MDANIKQCYKGGTLFMRLNLTCHIISNLSLRIQSVEFWVVWRFVFLQWGWGVFTEVIGDCCVVDVDQVVGFE